MMQYQINIPEYMWYTGNQFKSYVVAYLKKNHPEMKPVRVRQYKYIVCERKEVDEDGDTRSKATVQTSKANLGKKVGVQRKSEKRNTRSRSS